MNYALKHSHIPVYMYRPLGLPTWNFKFCKCGQLNRPGLLDLHLCAKICHLNLFGLNYDEFGIKPLNLAGNPQKCPQQRAAAEVKIATFYHPSLFHAPLRRNPAKFPNNLWCPETGVIGLPFGENHVIVCLLTLTLYQNVKERRTETVWPIPTCRLGLYHRA